MLNVIVCDDNKRDLDRVVKLVDTFMQKNKYEYKKQVISLGVDSVTKVFGIGRNPKEDKAIEKLFTKGFLEKLTIKPSAIP